MDEFEEAKEANQKLKYSNERTSESWRKVEAMAGIKPAKDPGIVNRTFEK